MTQAQLAIGFGGPLNSMPFEPVSTLDAHVQAQDLDLQETLLEFVDSGILTGRKSAHFLAPRLAAKSSSPESATLKLAAPKQAERTVEAATETTQHADETQRTDETLQVGETPPRVSPFRKWVKPQPNNVADTASKEPAPQLARRARQSKPVKLSQPEPLRMDSEEAAKPELYEDSVAAEQEITPLPGSKTESRPVAPRTQDLPPLSPSQLNLRKKVRSVLTHYYNRPLNTRDRSPWELMHAMLAFEAHSKVLQGGPDGKPITAVGWLCYNQECKRRTLMYVDDDGQLQVRVGPALQGHRGQLLALLAQSRINENYPMLVEGNELKIADLIEMEKRTCYPRTELTFKLIALMHYLDSDATWLNDQGMQWSIPQLIAEELRQPVRGAACGGTHRLSGLTLAYKTREKRGEPVDGQYLNAKNFVARYQQYAYRLQNRDGSFSTEWFRGPGNENSLDRKIKTTGHILEWLLYAAGENELQHWRTTKAVNYLSDIMHQNRYKDWEAGPLGHAIHALLVYDRLVFSPYDDPTEGSPVATRPFTVGQTTQRR